ncbi:MAG: hypothetical protein JWM31_2773 [Solirubrobacterales bacterium]|nr:hypothetical protein [Solirubrobacterales bacterium]
MGLLDDAIREHLELKRQHGADATEVARQEHEALGPVVRGELAISGPPAGDPPAFAELAKPEVLADDAPIPIQDDAPVYADEAPTTVQPAADPEPALPDPVPGPTPGLSDDAGQPTVAFSLADLEAASAPPVTDVPPPVAPAPSPVEDLAWDAPATPPPAAEPAPLAPDIVPADEEPSEHDELEETPDFLQETPEHDRLWFEQKPPKDFDF